MAVRRHYGADCPTEGLYYGYGPDITSPVPGQADIHDPKLPGTWVHSINWRGNCSPLQATSPPVYMTNSTGSNSYRWSCFHLPGTEPSTISPVTPSALESTPATVTISAPVEGPTQIYIYGGDGYAEVAPTATTANSATFTFPVDNSQGQPFGAGTFAITVYSGPQGQTPVETGLGMMTVYGTTSIPGAFGVAAQSASITSFTPRLGYHGLCEGYTSSESTRVTPVVTSYTGGEVYYNGSTIPTGLDPTSIALYDDETTGGPHGNCEPYVVITEPSRAVVANSGGNSVSVLDILDREVLATVGVGETPNALTIGSGPTAYIANFNSGTVSVLDLASMAVTDTVSVGSYPDAIAMDPSGNAFWVGGENYVKEISTSNFGVLQTLAVSGYVTSVAVSQAQGQVFYGVSTGTDNPLEAQNTTTGGQVKGTYSFPQPPGGPPPGGCDGCQGGGGDSAMGGVSPDSLCCRTGYIPLQATSALVSSTANNSLAVDATPTGFALVSLVDNAVIYQGTTPNAVRGTAIAADQSVGYMTVPDSNELITLPIPNPN